MFEKLQMSMSKFFSASISHNFSFFMIIFHLLFIHLSLKLNKVIVFGCGIEASSTEAKGTVLLKGDEYVLAVTDTITVTVCYTIIVTITAMINVTISVSITVTISVTIVVTITVAITVTTTVTIIVTIIVTITVATITLHSLVQRCL